MSRKIGLKSLGLCFVAALAVMAFVAASAQAAAHWNVNGSELSSGTAEVASEEDEMPTLLVTLTSTGETVEILCNEFRLVEGLLEPAGKSKGKLEFKNDCLTKINGSLRANCAPTEPIVAEAQDQLFKHTNNKTYDRFSPKAGETKFVTLHFASGCVFGETVNIKGTAVVEDCLGQGEEEKVKHLIKQASDSLFTSDGLQFGSQGPAHLDGSIWVKLAGTHAGQNFSGFGS